MNPYADFGTGSYTYTCIYIYTYANYMLILAQVAFCDSFAQNIEWVPLSTACFGHVCQHWSGSRLTLVVNIRWTRYASSVSAVWLPTLESDSLLVLQIGNEGMTHFITIFIFTVIPTTPSNPSIPCVKRTSKIQASLPKNWYKSLVCNWVARCTASSILHAAQGFDGHASL